MVKPKREENVVNQKDSKLKIKPCVKLNCSIAVRRSPDRKEIDNTSGKVGQEGFHPDKVGIQELSPKYNSGTLPLIPDVYVAHDITPSLYPARASQPYIFGDRCPPSVLNRVYEPHLPVIGAPSLTHYGVGAPGLPHYVVGAPGLPHYAVGAPGLPHYAAEAPGLPRYAAEAPGLPRYAVGAPSLPHYAVGAPDLPHYAVGAPSPRPHSVTVPGPQPHGIVAPSEGSTAHGLSSDKVGVTAPPPSLKFPAVIMRGIHQNSREDDIKRFFRGLHVVDVFLVVTNNSFSGDAFVVFSSSAFVESALKRDGQKMGYVVVRVLTCSRQHYYNAIAGVANDDLDSSNSEAHTKVPDNNNLKDHTHTTESNVMADVSDPERPQGQITISCDNNTDHVQPEGEAKSILNKDKKKRKKKAKSLLDKDHPILKVCGPPHFADTNAIIEVFGECDLSEDRVHVVLHPSGKPTGEMFLEFKSQNDAKKAMSKVKTMIESDQLKILPATTEDLRVINTERKQETDGHGKVKESNNEPKLPDGHLQGEPNKSDGKRKFNTKVIRLRNVPPTADKHDIIELFGEFNLTLDRLHVVCRRNGMANGVVYVEFESVEDANKALSKTKNKIHSRFLQLSPSSEADATRAMTVSW